MSFTSNALANLEAEAHQLDEPQKARFFRTARNLVSKGVVPYTIDEDDPREAKVYEAAAAGVILLLAPLAGMGVETVVLRPIAATLLAPSPVTGKRLIDRLFAAVRDGRRADLVVSLERVGTEPQGIVTRVAIEDEEPSADVAAILDAHHEAAVEVLAEMRVNANARLRPLIDLEG